MRMGFKLTMNVNKTESMSKAIAKLEKYKNECKYNWK